MIKECGSSTIDLLKIAFRLTLRAAGVLPKALQVKIIDDSDKTHILLWEIPSEHLKYKLLVKLFHFFSNLISDILLIL